MTTGIDASAQRTWTRMPPFRAVLAVDARNFSVLDGVAMGRVNSGIQELLARATAGVGLTAEWEQKFFGYDTGDGYVAGFPPEVLPGLLGCFPAVLRRELLEWNTLHPQQTPLQLRVSLHHGAISDNGLAPAMVETHRLLDDQGLRELLSRADPRLTPVAMVVSQRVYEDVFASGCKLGDTTQADFRACVARAKKFAQRAWLHVPGLDWGLADPVLSSGPDETAVNGADVQHKPSEIPAAAINAQVLGNAPTWIAERQEFGALDFRTLQACAEYTPVAPDQEGRTWKI